MIIDNLLSDSQAANTIVHEYIHYKKEKKTTDAMLGLGDFFLKFSDLTFQLYSERLSKKDYTDKLTTLAEKDPKLLLKLDRIRREFKKRPMNSTVYKNEIEAYTEAAKFAIRIGNPNRFVENGRILHKKIKSHVEKCYKDAPRALHREMISNETPVRFRDVRIRLNKKDKKGLNITVPAIIGYKPVKPEYQKLRRSEWCCPKNEENLD